jgi:hypothetical protein
MIISPLTELKNINKEWKDFILGDKEAVQCINNACIKLEEALCSGTLNKYELGVAQWLLNQYLFQYKEIKSNVDKKEAKLNIINSYIK